MANYPAFRRDFGVVCATKGVTFPATRGEIVTRAAQNEAPPDILERLNTMREAEFENLADVIDATNE